jgi:hypothetical protein
MKNCRLALLFLLPMTLVLAACASIAANDPANNAGDQATPIPEATAAISGEMGAANCPAAAPGEHFLRDAAHGLCFLFPDTYDVFQGEDGSFTLYQRSLLNTEAPTASFHFEPANGRTFDAVSEQRQGDYAIPDTEAQTINLGGQAAVMLDNLPGQDTNRRVVALRDGLIYDMVISRIGPDYGSTGEQAETLYRLITSSLQFIGIEPDALLQAGPECPEELAGTALYTNVEDRFCLLLPDGYIVEDSLITDDGDSKTAVFSNSMQDVSHGRLFITVEDAGGRSLEEITTAREAEVETALPGTDIMWSFGYMLDGVPANQFDQLPGQDLSREVLLVRNGRMYTLRFVPDDPDIGDAYAEMQSLYDLVMDSFSFLWQE